MNKREEQVYAEGSKSAYIDMLCTCLRNLDSASSELEHSCWVLEKHGEFACFRKLDTDDVDLTLEHVARLEAVEKAAQAFVGHSWPYAGPDGEQRLAKLFRALEEVDRRGDALLRH